MTVCLSQSSKQELQSFSSEYQGRVSEAISFLENDSFREQNRIDLVLIEEGYKIWALVVGEVWLSFHEDNGNLCVDWVSLRSRFRP